ncbi:tRNA-uridine aminocarboxypropyltransferase [Oleisolibacter albus]|uniref:tRNA-uridine aminocarboxypropyltransferase n=1 Tax=Oleisolibacter albus TaxID=2171757 RepID=UPI000DF186D1|nr:tRNA-uridine aminocarboxypropyltransferase [Oleisolibacter albus]
MSDELLSPPPPAPPEPCKTCGKPPDLCLCAELEPVRTRLGLLILQHPQEQDVELGTARLLSGQIEGAVVKVGLSWANLAKALGRSQADPRRWGVLHMGSKEDVAKVPRGGIAVVGKNGPLPDSDIILADLEGLVLIDGTWSQAKTLWWRNAWLLKLRRVVIHPDFRSAYGTVRREPRKESVSTLEAGAFAFGKLEGDPGLQERLLQPFDQLLDRWKKRRRRPHPPAPAA